MANWQWQRLWKRAAKHHRMMANLYLLMADSYRNMWLEACRDTKRWRRRALEARQFGTEPPEELPR